MRGQCRHGRSLPTTATLVNNAPAPPLLHNANAGVRDLSGRAPPLDLQHATDHPLQVLRDRTGVAVGHQPAVGVHREPAVMVDVPLVHERAAFAGAAEAVRLELADDLERERVVELEDVDVGRSEPARRERSACGPATDETVVDLAGRRPVRSHGAGGGTGVRTRRARLRGRTPAADGDRGASPLGPARPHNHLRRSWSSPGGGTGRRSSATRERPPS